MSDDKWETYLRWDAALRDVVFNRDSAGLPVYLDIEDDVLALAAAAVDCPPEEAVASLTSAVQGSLSLVSGNLFGRHTRALAAWRRVVRRAARESRQLHDDSPPIIALLAVFSLAAEQMGADPRMAANAYYPRLADLLGIDRHSQQQLKHLTQNFRSVSEDLWRGLNQWLEINEGEYGLPTAYALGQRFVGIPQSQALVRAGDRQKFPQLFAMYGLPPGAEVAASDLERMLGTWIGMNPSPASVSLRSLWSKPAARERIAEVAAVELLSWDGEGSAPDGGSAHHSGAGPGRQVSLTLLQQKFPRPRVDISFVVTAPSAQNSTEFQVMTAQGEPVIDMTPLGQGRLRPSVDSTFDLASLLEGLLSLRDPESELEYQRRPRRVVPLRRDELLNVFVEVERVQLGEDTVVLVRDDGDLVARVEAVLAAAGRPGYKRVDGHGVPEGWVLFADVQFFASPPQGSAQELNALVPVIEAQLTVSGGLRIPGRIRKWSSMRPPEIRAVTQEAERVEVHIKRLASIVTEDEDSWSRTFAEDGSSLIVDLAEESFGDGDYEIVFRVDGKEIQQSILRLRSADTPDTVSWSTADRLVHLAETPLAVISADPWDGTAEVLVEGAITPGQTPDGAEMVASVFAVSAPQTPHWIGQRSLRQSAPAVVISAPDPTSCLVTGKHHFWFPTQIPGQRVSWLVGECTGCGQKIRARTWIPRHGRRAAQHVRANPLDLSRLPEPRESHLDWSPAIDALEHLGGGRGSALDSVALEIEGSQLFANTFIRSMEAAGNLEVMRGPDGSVRSWEMAPVCLAEQTDGVLSALGCWLPQNLSVLAEATRRLGGDMVSGQSEGLPTIRVSDVDAGAMEALLAEMDPDISVVRNAAGAMASALPALGALERALPRTSMKGADRLQFFDVTSASWMTTDRADRPGAYRLRSGFATTDVFRSPVDVENGTAARAPVQLTKHLSAWQQGRPLLAYDGASECLMVPLGADLPGLYGRAAFLCSGDLPQREPSKRTLIYRGVTKPIADRLTALLLNGATP